MIKKYLAILILLVFATVAYGSSQQTSSTSAATIVDRAEVWLNDSDNRFWTAGELLQWLNDGMVDIVTRSHCLEGTDTETLVANTIEYAISAFDSAPWYYLTIKSVSFIDSDSKEWALEKSSPDRIGQNTTATKPKYWYEWNGKIGVFPALSSINGVTAETIKVYYVVRPTAIASGANVTTPAIYDTALTLYIVAQAWMKDLQLNKYLQTMALYDAEMARIRQDLNEHPRGVQ